MTSNVVAASPRYEICGSTFLFTFLGSNKKAGRPAFAKHPAIF
jgi:hypothetical protein